MPIARRTWPRQLNWMRCLCKSSHSATNDVQWRHGPVWEEQHDANLFHPSQFSYRRMSKEQVHKPGPPMILREACRALIHQGFRGLHPTAS